jgi:DNA-directed RNA polymerase specialized sigma24 family protein
MMNDLISMPAIPRTGVETSSEELVRIFSELGPKLLSTLLCLVGNHADAQDAIQDAFLKCWRARTSRAQIRDMLHGSFASLSTRAAIARAA